MPGTRRAIALSISMLFCSMSHAQTAHDSVLCNVVSKADGRAVPPGSIKLSVQVSGRKVSDIRVEQREGPRRIMLLQDASGSMSRGNAQQLSTEAIQDFIESASTGDQLALVDFNDRYYLDITPRSAVAFSETYHNPKFREKVRFFGGTALFDALFASVSYLETEPQEGDSIVIISDGDDNASQLNLAKLKDKLFASRIRVYLIVLETPEGHNYPQAGWNRSKMIDVIRDTGGVVGKAGSKDTTTRELVETIHGLIEAADKLDFDLDSPIGEPARLEVRVSKAGGEHVKDTQTYCPRYLGPVVADK